MRLSWFSYPVSHAGKGNGGYGTDCILFRLYVCLSECKLRWAIFFIEGGDGWGAEAVRNGGASRRRGGHRKGDGQVV